jgi:hypothetical protein
MKTWTARIEIAGETLDATPSRWDTLKETTRAALLETAEYVQAGFADHARVVLYKTTKARGTERDRSYLVGADRDGAVWSQYQGQ